MKNVLLCWLIVVPQFVLLAHDCFLIVRPYRVSPGDDVKIELHVDEHFPGKHIVWNPERFTRFHHWYGRTLLDSVVPDPVKDSSGVLIPIAQGGVHLIAADRSPSFIQLDAKQFDQYLQSEGLDNVLKLRKERKEENKPGREKYSRYLKALVSAGEGEQNTYRQVIGQIFEIIPLENPCAKKVGDTLRLRIFYQGKAVSGKKISATYAGASEKPDTYDQSTRTNREGIASFRLSHKGTWLIRTVTMQSAETPDADWESFWASLTFEVR
ncbi:MAG TPA: DUF4198 domain-containing protein [Bacteroidota bacterium]|nr:DUF4198 domain-containing protein [Bacteroidota bacterium]